MTRQLKILFLAGALVVAIVGALCIGTTMLSPAEMVTLLLNPDSQDFVIWQHRLPRTLVGIMVGASIGVAGALIQGVVRNPLASPDIIGVTQGAGLALTIIILLVPQMPSAWLPFWACAGGAVGAGLLFWYTSATSFQPVKFAVSGVAISLCFSGVTEFLLLTYPTDINTTLLVLTGSLWARGWTQVTAGLFLLGLIAAAIPLSKSLDLLHLGEEAATSLGGRLQRTRLLSLSLAVLLTGVSVSIVGPLTFVGLMVPHLARRLVGGQHLALMPASALIGSVVVVMSDTVGRGLAPPLDIPAGILTAVVGAPYFLWLLFRMR